MIRKIVDQHYVLGQCLNKGGGGGRRVALGEPVGIPLVKSSHMWRNNHARSSYCETVSGRCLLVAKRI